MEKTSGKELLKNIECSRIVIQAYDDNIEKPESATYILDNVCSEKIESYIPDMGKHLIVLTGGRHEAFRRTAEFLESL